MTWVPWGSVEVGQERVGMRESAQGVGYPGKELPHFQHTVQTFSPAQQLLTSCSRWERRLRKELEKGRASI